MSFAILRINKIKSVGSANGLNSHLERTIDVPNADPRLTHLNERLHGSGDLYHDIMARIEEVGCNVRKNAVLGVEFMLTASPEFFEDDKTFKAEVFKHAALGWLEKEYGKKNLVNFTIHNDERTPHCHAVVVPIDEKNKLNARAMSGGREKLRKMQDSFAESVQTLGLDRGIRGSKAEHVELKKYYGLVKNINKEIKQPEQKIKIDLPRAKDYLNLNKWKETQEDSVNKQIAELTTFIQQSSTNEAIKALERFLGLKNRKRLNREVETAKYEIIKRFEPQVLALDKENKELKEKVSILENDNTSLNNKIPKILKNFNAAFEKIGYKFNYKTLNADKIDINLNKGMSR